MLGAAVGMGYMYQGPPFRLSYKGLGEPLCFAAFGPLATTAFYLAQARAGPGPHLRICEPTGSSGAGGGLECQLLRQRARVAQAAA